MFGSNILEIVIGLVFIYLLYSLLATTIKEGIAAVLGLRAKMLEKAIRRMLDDGINQPDSLWAWCRSKIQKLWNLIFKSFLYIFPVVKIKNTKEKLLVHKFYDHPGVKYLSENRLYKRPSYISPEFFSKALVDILKELGTDPAAATQTNAEKIYNGINKINKLDETKKLILSFYEDANQDIDKFRAAIEQWFNETMTRASGWYKKQAQWIILAIGFALAVVFNVDTLSIVKKLSKDKDARKELADLASSSYKTLSEKRSANQSVNDSAKVDSLFNYARGLIKEDINDANTLIGLGWYIPASADTNKLNIPGNASDYANDIVNCKVCLKSVTGEDKKAVLTPFQKVRYVWCMSTHSARKFLGYLITALAISFGAPFWFDLLSNLMQIRGSGKKPEEDKPKDKKQPEIKRVG